MFKKFLARKKDFRQLVRSEVDKALAKRDNERDKIEEEMRRKHQRTQADFQIDMNKEISKSKKEIRKHFEALFEDEKEACSGEIKELKTTIKDMETKVKFVQWFWRSTIKEKDYITNLAAKVSSEIQLVFDDQAYKWKNVESLVTRIGASANRLDDMNEKHGEKLLTFLEDK